MSDSPERGSDDHSLDPGRNCWRIERADKVRLIVDAADYFATVRQAMMTAEKRIMLIGWDFDARIRIGPQRNPTGAPSTIGRFILWLNNHRPDLNVYLLRWDFGAFKAMFRGTTPVTVARWALHKRIHVKLDAAHPFGASHHQKIVVIDDCLAFCGGIDITSGRWDTREHLDHDPRRIKPHGNPGNPWHDATLALSGPAAKALDELARERWRYASGETLEPLNRGAKLWPQGLQPHFENVDVAIARTRPAFGEVDAVHEIEELYLDMIARAKRYVYVEGQYFASGRVAEAISRRLAEDDGPEFVVVSPEQAHGWLEQVAMDTARSRLFEAVKQYDRHNRLRVYTPCTALGRPIYVHAKIMVVDDLMLRVGSSNLNNRSMRLDTECDVVLDATLPGQAHIAKTIREIRDDLAAEHLGATGEEFGRVFEATGSLIEAVEQLRAPGRTLKPYLPPVVTRLGTFLAERQLLDPDGPEQTFDPFARRSLFRRLRRPPSSA